MGEWGPYVPSQHGSNSGGQAAHLLLSGLTVFQLYLAPFFAKQTHQLQGVYEQANAGASRAEHSESQRTFCDDQA